MIVFQIEEKSSNSSVVSESSQDDVDHTPSSSTLSCANDAVTNADPQPSGARFVQPPIHDFTSGADGWELGLELLKSREGEGNDIVQLSEQAFDRFPKGFAQCKESRHDLSWSLCKRLFGLIIDSKRR